jgi:Fe-S cluster biogenesis protein NfuA|tara:strand:- start:1581 stop:2144 length:564 start_codon:yes stop_codon:yes gene_type:complete
MNKIINIYVEANPNPNSLKFVADKMLIDDGIVKDYPDIESASESPIAQALFGFRFIKRVFIMSNFITLTKDENTTWDDIKMELKDFIKKYLEEDKIIINKEIKNENKEPTTDVDKKIIDILEEYIKPAVEQDGGAIQFESFNKGTVTVSLQGACSGCPSSMITLKAGIEKLLKRFIPEVDEVVAQEV